MAKISYIICLAFLFRIATSRFNIDCVTPHGLNGVCTNVEKCPVLLTMRVLWTKKSSLLHFYVKSRCKGLRINHIPFVCCPLDDQYLSFTDSQISKTSSATNSEVKSDCITPNNAYGVCKYIQNCPELLPMLKYKKINYQTKKFLKNSYCENDGFFPKLCCPLNDETKQLTKKKISSYVLPLNTDDLDDGSCGLINGTMNRIVGGSQAGLGAWPWMTSLGYRKNDNHIHVCGGSLISDRYIISVAHCFHGTVLARNQVYAHLGDLNLDPNVDDRADPIDIPILQIMKHEQYDKNSKTNDIALLKLDRIVRFNHLIHPICLPILSDSESDLSVNTRPFIAGWGATAFAKKTSDDLMQLHVSILDISKCKKLYSSTQVIDDRVICAGFLDGERDACEGDSGGPLMIPRGKQFYLEGLVAQGHFCAVQDYPGVYTKVSKFVDWIETKMINS